MIIKNIVAGIPELGRIITLLLLIFLAACVLAVSPTAAKSRSQTEGAEAGVYAFLPSFVMDIERKAFLNRRSRRGGYFLRNCSNAEDFCLKSKEFKVSFPRSCSAREAFFKSENGLIVAELTRRTHLLSWDAYAYFDPEYPDYAFLIYERGLFGIIYHPLADDLKADLQLGALQQPDHGVSEVGYTYGDLASKVPLFDCVPD